MFEHILRKITNHFWWRHLCTSDDFFSFLGICASIFFWNTSVKYFVKGASSKKLVPIIAIVATKVPNAFLYNTNFLVSSASSIGNILLPFLAIFSNTGTKHERPFSLFIPTSIPFALLPYIGKYFEYLSM